MTQSLTQGYWATAIPEKQFLPGADLSLVLASAAVNDPSVVRIPAPTLIMQGGADVTVLPQTTDEVVKTLCALGNDLTYLTFPTADHEAVVVQGEADAQAWVEARFEGAPSTSNCADLPSAAR